MEVESFSSDSTYCSTGEKMQKQSKCKKTKAEGKHLNAIHEKIRLHFEGKKLLSNFDILIYLKEMAKMQLKTYYLKYLAEKVRTALFKIYKLNSCFERKLSQAGTAVAVDPLSSCNITQDCREMKKDVSFQPQLIRVPYKNSSATSFKSDLLSNKYFLPSSSSNASNQSINNNHKVIRSDLNTEQYCSEAPIVKNFESDLKSTDLKSTAGTVSGKLLIDRYTPTGVNIPDSQYTRHSSENYNTNVDQNKKSKSAVPIVRDRHSTINDFETTIASFSKNADKHELKQSIPFKAQNYRIPPEVNIQQILKQNSQESIKISSEDNTDFKTTSRKNKKVLLDPKLYEDCSMNIDEYSSQNFENGSLDEISEHTWTQDSSNTNGMDNDEGTTSKKTRKEMSLHSTMVESEDYSMKANVGTNSLKCSNSQLKIPRKSKFTGAEAIPIRRTPVRSCTLKKSQLDESISEDQASLSCTQSSQIMNNKQITSSNNKTVNTKNEVENFGGNNKKARNSMKTGKEASSTNSSQISTISESIISVAQDDDTRIIIVDDESYCLSSQETTQQGSSYSQVSNIDLGQSLKLDHSEEKNANRYLRLQRQQQEYEKVHNLTQEMETSHVKNVTFGELHAIDKRITSIFQQDVNNLFSGISKGEINWVDIDEELEHAKKINEATVDDLTKLFTRVSVKEKEETDKTWEKFCQEVPFMHGFTDEEMKQVDLVNLVQNNARELEKISDFFINDVEQDMFFRNSRFKTSNSAPNDASGDTKDAGTRGNTNNQDEEFLKLFKEACENSGYNGKLFDRK